MGTFNWMFIGFIVTMCVWTSGSTSEPPEKRLHRDLLTGRKYSKLIRPSGTDGNSSVQKLTVKLGMRLSQLLDIVSI